MITTLRADLHLHSALSPCAESSMSPAGLVRAALTADLAVIAVTDHNAVCNLAAVQAAAERVGIWVIPGMEVQTKEEVHLLCYFPDLAAAGSFAAFIWEYLPPFPNDERFFGRQEVYDPEGRPAGTCDRLLLCSADLSVEEVFRQVEAHGGICLPAHVDRRSFGLLGQLGLVPEVFPLHRPFELSPLGEAEKLRAAYRLPSTTRFFRSSDAHRPAEVGRQPSLLRVAAAGWEEFV
ncbi:MAG: PHP domain-containing protein, partial [Firmicutes bacterium]|nr:PHP domain-containing protein [Bacillota bacterium]